MFVDTWAIWVKFVPSRDLSTMNPPSLVDVSLQDRLIWNKDTELAVRLVGAVGMVCARTVQGKPIATSANATLKQYRTTAV
jgi:hypothetical protein